MKSFLFFLVAWLLLCALSLVWYLGQPRGSGCDGGLCLLGPFVLLCFWAGSGMVTLLLFLVVKQLSKRE